MLNTRVFKKSSLIDSTTTVFVHTSTSGISNHIDQQKEQHRLKDVTTYSFFNFGNNLKVTFCFFIVIANLALIAYRYIKKICKKLIVIKTVRL